MSVCLPVYHYMGPCDSEAAVHHVTESVSGVGAYATLYEWVVSARVSVQSTLRRDSRTDCGREPGCNPEGARACIMGSVCS